MRIVFERRTNGHEGDGIGSNFLETASSIAIKPEVEEFALEDANRALVELKERNIRGAKVLRL